jgi:GWxTD domain-containing protein
MTATRLCACCSALCLALAAQSDPPKTRQTKKQEQRLRKELQGTYYNWLTRDVAYIITDAETQAFKRLQNDDEREQFVEQFWLRRDPTPDTQENEFKEEHYRRIAYANDHFASGVEGWRTERGRMYITFGPPDEIEAHPSGGPYQRPLEQGGGTGTAYPFETWRYRFIEGIGTNVEILFVDPTLTGEYRIALDPEEVNALAHVTPPPATQTGASDSGSKQFDRLRLYDLLHRPPPGRFPELEALVKSAIRFNTLPMQVRADFLRVTDSTVLTPVTIQFENRDLQFRRQDGPDRATVNLYMRVTSLARRLITVQEDVVTIDSPAGMLQQTSKRSSVYQRFFYLTPGTYRLNVVARDLSSGNTNTYEMALHVPQFKAGVLAASSIILADSIEKVPARTIGMGQFVLGDSKVRPRVSGIFGRDEKMGIYFQVYRGAETPAGEKVDGSIEYVVTKSGSSGPAIDFTEALGAIRGASGQNFAVEKMLALGNLEAGDYTLKIVITDRSSNQVVSPSAPFSVR